MFRVEWLAHIGGDRRRLLRLDWGRRGILGGDSWGSDGSWRVQLLLGGWTESVVGEQLDGSCDYGVLLEKFWRAVVSFRKERFLDTVHEIGCRQAIGHNAVASFSIHSYNGCDFNAKH